MIRYAIALAVLLILAAAFSWAFIPARYLTGNRVRYLRLRLRLRVHPGKGLAGIVSLWLRWGRVAAWRRSGRIRPSLSPWQRILAAGEHSVFLGWAQWRHRLRVPLEEHVLVMAPPRTYKTAFLADVILRYPGPVISTTTKADVHPRYARSTGRCTCSTPSTSAGWRPRSAGPRLTGARTRRRQSGRRTRSRSRSPSKASRTAPSGQPRPATTCAVTSTPPRCRV
jgi:hypothetical protein